MNHHLLLSVLLSPDETTALDFGAMFGLFLLVALVTLWCVFGFKKKRRRKRKHRHRPLHSESRPPQFTGLPPLREHEDEPGPPPEH